MLDKKRIKEAEENVRRYLEEGLLKKVEKIDENILSIMKKNSEDSLKTADFLFKNNISWLWIIVSSYYAMFYSANHALYKLRYKIGDKIVHKVAADSLIVFIRNKLKSEFLENFEAAKEEAMELAGIKADSIIESFVSEMEKRSKFQYEMTEESKKSKAETSLKRAKEFVFEIEKLDI